MLDFIPNINLMLNATLKAISNGVKIPLEKLICGKADCNDAIS